MDPPASATILNRSFRSGLVAFHYPGAHDLESGEFEVVGIEGSKETIESRLGMQAVVGNATSRQASFDAAESLNGQEPQSASQSTTSPVPVQSQANTPSESSSMSLSQPDEKTAQVNGVSRRDSLGSVTGRSFNSTSASIPTQKSKSSGKFRKRLTTTGSKIKQFGSMRSLASKSN